MWQKVALLILACAGGLYAQNPNPCRQVQNAATSGQVLSAASSGSTPTCKWITGGGGGGGVSEIDTALPITGGPITTTGTVGCRTATGSVSGCLSATDWTTFNGKQAAGSYVLTTRSIATTAPLAGGGDLSADRTFTCNVASGSQPGCLSAADWTTFNGKQAAGAYATCSGDLSGTAPGCTVSKINGTSFAGTSGHLVSFGAANIPADSGLVAANQVNASSPGVGIAHFAGSTQTVTSSLIVAADITSSTITGAQIASSIALAGSPTTTTQSPGDNSTKIATTAYVNAAAGGCTSLCVIGTASFDGVGGISNKVVTGVIANITRTSAGLYNVVFTTNQSNYTASLLPNSGTSVAFGIYINTTDTSPPAAGFQFATVNLNGGNAPTDCGLVMVTIFK